MTPNPGARPPRHIRVVTVVAAVCAVALLASSCSTRPSDTTFTGPTVFSPRSPSSVAVPTSPAYQTDVPTASPELYKQAYDLYTLYFSYDAFLQQDGGTAQLPPELAALLTGEALRKEADIQKQAKDAGVYWVGSPRFAPVKVAQLMTDVPNATVIALQACEVTTGAKLMMADGTQIGDGSPVMVLRRYYMNYDKQHQLVIYDISGGTEWLSSCPF